MIYFRKKDTLDMLPSNINLPAIRNNFLKELQDANNGRKTSLPFIINQLSFTPLVKDNEQFQILGIGGSAFFNALATSRNGKIALTITKQSQVHFQSMEEFLSLIEAEVDESVSILAINFAYPLQPIFETGELDGILLANSKENDFGSLIGKRVGHEIENYVLEKRGKKINVSIANDTVCLVLSGLTQFSWKNLACGIVGTGLNFAYFLDLTHVVNLEAANFDKFSQSEEGKLIDENSNIRGEALFEKETSGAYLYQHFNYHIQHTGIHHLPLKETKELSTLSEQDIPEVSEFARSLLEKSAALVATQIAGITKLKQKDMTFIMQGSVFWEGYHYKKWVEEYVRFLEPNYSVSFVRIENSSLLGAAKLVC